MKRWYYRLRPFDPELGGDTFSHHDNYMEDYFLAFFISCYHLKDWIKEYVNITHSTEEYINNNLPLQIAGDVANFSKHSKLTPKPRTGDINTKPNDIGYLKMTSYGSSYVVKDMYIESNGQIYNAFQVATECMRLWYRFLNNQSIALPDEMNEEVFYENFKKFEI